MFKALRASPFFSLARSHAQGGARKIVGKQACRSFHTSTPFTATSRKGVTYAVGTGIGLTLGWLYINQRVVRADDNETPIQVVASDEKKETDPNRVKVEKYKYVIIGAGTAGHAALVAILQKDPEAKVLVIAGEPHLPYNRPPLSKDLWNSEDPNVSENLRFKNWEGTESSVWFEGVDYKDDPRVIFQTIKAIDLDPYNKLVLLDDDSIIEYEKCLIATGGDPRVLPAGKGLQNVSTYRTLDDFKRLDKIAREVKHIVIIGGGFLGSELAWSVSKKGVKVTQVFPEKGVLASAFPDYLSDYVTNLGRNAGMDIHPETLVNLISQRENGGLTVTLDNGQTVDADHVVMAAGITPTNQLASGSDLEIDSTNGGIVVNPELQIRTGLYAAGDVVSYFDPIIGVRRRIEHHDHAVNSGKLAGRNMTGEHMAYYYLPFFWSDIGPVGFEAVGIVDSKLDKVAVWEKPEGIEEVGPNPAYKRGIIYYLKNDVVVGVLLLGVYGKVETARAVIKRKQKITNHEWLQRFISLEEEHH